MREVGEDVEAGDVVLRRGTLLGPGQIALARGGRHSPRCGSCPRPRVVVVSTGDELVEVGRTPGFGQIVDSNSVMLTAAVDGGRRRRRSASVACPTTPATLLETLEGQLVRADVIITTGGVSMGAFDTVKEVLSRVGTVQFDKVAMRPGMPQGFGVLGEEQVPVFTLPGNPVSALVSFHVFVAPGPAGDGRSPRAVLPAGLRPRRRRRAVRLRRRARWSSCAWSLDDDRARLAGGQGSHMLGALAAADALAVIPADVTEVARRRRADVPAAARPGGPVTSDQSSL